MLAAGPGAILLTMNRQTDSRLPLTGGRRIKQGLAAMAAALALVPTVANGSQAEARALVESYVRDSVGTGHRVEVELGRLDPKVNDPACRRVEPFVPAGARLWGRSRIGLRCLEGANWNLALPVQVRVFAPVLVASTTLLAGTVASDAGFRIAEVDLTRHANNLLSDPALLDGKVLGRTLSAGQPLQAEHLRIAQTVAPGDPVHIRLIGQGFEIGAEGIALSGAGDGQPVRVRTGNGKVLSGTTRGRTVEIRM